MKCPLFLSALLVLGINTSAQITTVESGLSTPTNPSTVRLGGSLLQNTNIDLGNDFYFNFKRNTNNILSFSSNGNIAIGGPNVDARINFPYVGENQSATGISWLENQPTQYGIHRTAGPWDYPNYQQLRLGWLTGIVIDPGNAYVKSYVDIQGNGLRVTQGKVGIGTTEPYALLSLGNSVSGAKLAIWEGIYRGQLLRSGFGVAANQFRIFVPDMNSRYPFLSDEAGTNEVMTIQGMGNVGVGNATPHSKLEVGTSLADDQTPNTAAIWDTYNARFNNGNVAIFSAGNVYTTRGSGQLSFYSRYWNGTNGEVTNKSAYIKGTTTEILNNTTSMWDGRGTLVLGSTNTSYNPIGFTDVPTMYLYNGQVGIGVTAPEAQLHSNGSVRFSGLTNDNSKERIIVSDANGNLAYRDAATLAGSGTAGWGFGGNSVATSYALGTTSNFDLPIITNNSEQMRIGANGNVGIGTTSIANYKLSVNGNIRARKLRVDQDTWADYVFEKTYQLRSIYELEKYIQSQKHLPDVPFAAEIKKEGLDLGANQVVLLKK